MATCVFRTSSISGTNADKKRGGTVTGNFYRYSGTLPPAGSSLQKVTVYFSNVSVYSTSSAGFSTAYGSVELGSSSGSHECTMYDASSSLLNFTGGNITFTVTGGGSSTSNVLNVRDGSYISISIEYLESNSSTGSLSSSSVAQGGSIKLTIASESSEYTHKVKWYRSESYTSEVSLSAGVYSTTLSVPKSWPTGQASVTLSTYSGSNLIGSYSYTFTITVDPTTIAPTAGTLTVRLLQSSYIPSAWGLYVKGYSRARLSLSGCAAGSGADYKSIALSCGSQSQSSQNGVTFDTDALQETGTVTCNAKVTNSYGNSASASAVNITVYDYFEPIFAVVTAFRCNSSGTPTDSGAYIGVTASVSIASVNGKNSLVSLQARYKKASATSWSTAQAITNGKQTIIGGSASGSETYQVQVIAIDSVQNLRNTNSNATVTALTSEHVIYCMDGGLNVSFGMEGTKQNAVQISPNWHLYHGETQLDGTVPISRGGTGQTSVKAARNALGLGNTKGALPIANGGTGQTSVEAARNALGLGNTKGALPVANGGTGATDAATARSNLGVTLSNLGAAPASHNHNASNINAGTLDRERLPFKFAWGSTSISGSSGTWIDYSSAGFTSTPYVFVTYSTSGSNWSGDNGAIKVSNKGTSGCSIVVGGSFSTSRAVDWFAIGT